MRKGCVSESGGEGEGRDSNRTSWERVKSHLLLSITEFPFDLSKVDSAISCCSEMHDMKEAIYEYKKKLEGIGEDYQIQVL